MSILWNTIWVLIQVFIGFHLVMPALVYILYMVTRRKQVPSPPAVETDYAIIITAYEQTASLPAVVQSVLQMNYTSFIVYIVADKCDISQLHFTDERVVVLRPPETLASNTRSHFYAINRFIRPHERLTIIDSDNLVHPQYLKELDRFFALGFRAVQGTRAAKNLDTTFARLDAARDLYYHYFDGKLLFNIGSSATLAGSGMAFETSLYNECLAHRDITGAGFDKVLQAAIVGKNLRIAFAGDAIVYDEKTTGSGQLVNQRARWINTWFKYFSLGFGLMAKGFSRFSINQLLFGLTLLRPPLFIFLLLSGFFFLINLVLWNVTGMVVWIAAFLLFVLGFLIAVNQPGTDKRILQSLKSIPVFIYYQVISLVKSRTANKRSVATKHVHSADIEQVLSENKHQTP